MPRSSVRSFSAPRRRPPLRLSAAGLAVLLAGCSSLQVDPPRGEEREPGIFGPGGILSLRGGDLAGGSDAETLRVNQYLWRASLDVVARTGLPLAASDPFGGVIATDWGALDGDAQTQFTIAAYVDSPQLRADALRVVVNKRVRDSGDWIDAPVGDSTRRQIENAILRRARELRLAELEAQE